MGNGSVKPLGNTNNPSIEDAKKWVTVMGQKGMYNDTTARLRNTAVEQLVSILGDDEPRDVRSVLENLDTIASRWATKNTANPGTTQTYKSRAKVTLEDYLSFLQDPTKFRPKRRGEGGESPAKRTTEKPKASAPKAAPPAPDAVRSPVAEAERGPADQTPNRSFPLDEGKAEFWYRLPAQGLGVRDVVRIACHLLTFARDFDPANPAHASMFAMSRLERK